MEDYKDDNVWLMRGATTKVLLDIARSDGSYETEYDGRMYTFCFFCGGENGDHNHDCTITQARTALGEIWTQEVAEQAEILRKKQEQEDKLEEYFRKRRTVVFCVYCGKKTREIAIERHQKESAKCKAKRASHVEEERDRYKAECEKLAEMLELFVSNPTPVESRKLQELQTRN